jgi:hypothetical protein
MTKDKLESSRSAIALARSLPCPEWHDPFRGQQLPRWQCWVHDRFAARAKYAWFVDRNGPSNCRVSSSPQNFANHFYPTNDALRLRRAGPESCEPCSISHKSFAANPAQSGKTRTRCPRRGKKDQSFCLTSHACHMVATSGRAFLVRRQFDEPHRR